MLARERQKADRSPPPAVAVAVRDAVRFERGSTSVLAGLLAAVPVVATLGGGLAAGDPVAAVTMGAGAMLVGTAWRTGGGRPPLALMATDAAVMAISTFVGCVSGSRLWIHLAVLCVWSLMAGLLVALGKRGAVVGTQAIIAAVVFGRFSQPPLASLGLAGLVLAGGSAQVAFQSVVRWPTPLRAQRAAVAAAYRVLSSMAVVSSQTSTLPAANALDEAEAALSSPILFGDPAVSRLRSLGAEGQRIRVHLSAIHALQRQERELSADSRTASGEPAERMLQLTATALDLAARALEGDTSAAAALSTPIAQLSSEAKTLGTGAMATASRATARLASSAALQMTRRLTALAAQIRAIGAMAPAAAEGGGLRSRRLHRRTNQPIERLRTDLAQIRANASLASPAGRHALRLAVVVVVTELIARELPLQRSYWLVVAAATVLRPEFGATFTRGTERALGTCLGVALAGAIVVGLHPAGSATVVIVGLLACAGYAVFPASFAVGFGFITAVVVFLLNAIAPDTLATATARLLDTLVGGSIGLVVYALWPTWSQVPARQALADLVDAHRIYLHAALAAAIDGRRAVEQELRPLARRARLMRTEAEMTVARSLSEPATRRIDAALSQGTLAAMRRLIQAAHVLSLDVLEERDRLPLPSLAPMAADIDRQLALIADAVRAGPRHHPERSTLPDLRASYEAFERTSPHDSEGAALLAELDEIVDATNGVAVLVGLDPFDDDQREASDLGGGGSAGLADRSGT